jgi:hypothetical protein
MGTFRQGAWRALRKFILEERRDIAQRISVIEAELRRIGRVFVVYKREQDDAGNINVTEERVGLSITKGSSLVRLMQAYIAQGGNPYDISHFFIPDRALLIGEEADGTPRWGEVYPYGGVVYPQSEEYNEPLNSYGIWGGGFLPLRKYPPLRLGGRYDPSVEAEPFVNYIIDLRKWAMQEITYKRNNPEARIVKLCDLREELVKERDERIVQAFGGLVSALTEFDPERFADQQRVPRIVDVLDNIFYTQAEDGGVDFGAINESELAKYRNLFEDILPDEKNTAI